MQLFLPLSLFQGLCIGKNQKNHFITVLNIRLPSRNCGTTPPHPESRFRCTRTKEKCCGPMGSKRYFSLVNVKLPRLGMSPSYLPYQTFMPSRDTEKRSCLPGPDSDFQIANVKLPTAWHGPFLPPPVDVRAVQAQGNALFATRVISKGEIVFSEVPLMAAAVSELLHCHHCCRSVKLAQSPARSSLLEWSS